MAQHYAHGLVFLSVVVAILASYTALTLALRIHSTSGWSARSWLIGGGFAMGIGIWAMHFVGMLALKLPIPIAYDLAINLLSMVVAIAVSTFALRIASRPRVNRPGLVAAGIAMGIGICSMHYIGMASIVIQPAIRYDPYWVAASLAIAIAASFAALWIAFTTRESDWGRYRLLGAVVMGFAIAGMHYAGMVAAQFPAEARSSAEGFIDTGWLAGAVTTISMFILLAALLIAVLDAQAAARRRRMQASLAQAEHDSRAKDEFLAMLGHELRNPLASIASGVYLLRKTEPRSREWEFALDVISRQSSHLARMVEDLLDVGRATSGKLALELQAVDLDRAVRSALDSLAAAGRTVRHRIDYRGEPAWVRGDRTRLEQVVSNLVLNAVQHSPENSAVEVRVGRAGEGVVLSVRDYGIGLEPQNAAQVFDLFFQVSQGMHRGKGGLGIGLTLVRRIVTLHGGEVNVSSEGIGKGALFTVRLPRIEAPALAPSPAVPLPALSQREVLVIEDAEDARQSLRLFLEMHGHRVLTACDGATGLKTLVDRQPDLALIDIGLPELDGYEVAKRARSAGVRSRLVALTGYGLPEDRSRARRAGFDEHLTKPAAPERLLALLSETPSVAV
jgi:NO-binding membrane sensor protein with MHYT domain/CheY-like chemotaxis protein/nitrogen-specific signal transduction histidine kinase